MPNPAEMIAARDWLLLDGATGTNLFAMGLEAGEAPELWNIDDPAKITALYKGWAEAGSDIFLTNSFGGTAARLKLHDAQGRVRELNRAAAEIAREVADKSSRELLVAGSVGPTGEILEPVGEFSQSLASEMFEAQGAALLEGGADLLWVETISSAEEFQAAAAAFERLNAPWCGTMSFDTAGRTMMGLTSVGLAELVSGLDHAPLAFGANCGVGSSDLLRTATGFAGANLPIPMIAKGNAGIPKFVDGHIHYDGTPDLMADYAVLARDIGVKLIGGCCGTKPEHVRAMRKALEDLPKSEMPSLDTIAARLGPFSSDNDGSQPSDAPKPRERSGRRARRRD